ncbi:DnaJ domain-containing protein, putative [Eimeria maxima]|uniref:DnaJ domain-containing protein, putative n=1 Tax=Eimeria maxima TaxID=5804 RepID=U6M671_EIMMA|nr:DnaJ domain-containing protein, putative [Eimeria maxima]CDJ58543.1 DnaJ domain-containing protein, putative [Eimeria maxima]
MARSCRRQARVQDDGSDEAAQGEKAARGHPRDRNPEKPQKGRSEPSSKANTKTTSVSHSLYDLLGVPADASQKEITSAYRRRALLCHPDKIRQRQEGASGETGEESLEGKSYEEAYAYYREKFPEVTEEAINEFKLRYIGSEEEKEDILDFVNNDPSECNRYKEVLSGLLKAKKIKATEEYKKSFREFDTIAEKYKKRFEKEKGAARKGKASKEEDMSALALSILGNVRKREAASNRFLEELEQKYSKKKKKT